MKRSQHKSMGSPRTIRFLSFLMLILLVGCSAVGQIVPEGNRVPLSAEGIRKGAWQSQGFTVTFSYRLDRKAHSRPGTLEINGDVTYRFGSTDSLDVWIDFLDDGGKILKRQILYSSGYKTEHFGSRKERRFNETLQTPPMTTAISFAPVAIARSGHQ